jgi:uncharacterized protein
MIALETHAEGTILPVRAQAGARRNGIKGIHDGVLQVMVTQAPEKGRANKAIIAVLAEALGLRKSQIELLAGETSPQKRFLVKAIIPNELLQRLKDLLAE